MTRPEDYQPERRVTIYRRQSDGSMAPEVVLRGRILDNYEMPLSTERPYKNTTHTRLKGG